MNKLTDFVKQQVEASARVKEAFLADEKAMGTVAEVAALMVETYRRRPMPSIWQPSS